MMETTEGNKLIAEFMGFAESPYPNSPNKMYIDNHSFHIDDFKYHTSWDWLMPVVEKIEALEGGDMFSFFIVCKECDIAFSSSYNDKGEDWEAPSFKQSLSTKIESTFHAVIEFITWYNQTNK